MRFNPSIIVTLAVCLFASFANAAGENEPAVTLNVGDAAPAMVQGDYVKGDPVKELEKGKTYVVEFWATWCGPCRESIPHLSKLQEANKEIIFIGQDCWENDPAAVKKFVAEMGDKMNYHVALDSPAGERTGKMAKTWMMAAGESGIPTAFLVNGDGKIAWIGHPMELDAALTSYKAGKIDVNKAGAERAAMKTFDKEIDIKMRKKDLTGAIAVIDEYSKKYPGLATKLAGQKYSLLVQKKDFPAATAMARELSESAKDDADLMNDIAWSMVGSDSPFEHVEVDLAMKCAARAVELSPDNPTYLNTLAHVHALRGDFDKAMEVEKQAIAKSEAPMKKQFKKALKEFRARKAGK